MPRVKATGLTTGGSNEQCEEPALRRRAWPCLPDLQQGLGWQQRLGRPCCPHCKQIQLWNSLTCDTSSRSRRTSGARRHAARMPAPTWPGVRAGRRRQPGPGRGACSRELGGRLRRVGGGRDRDRGFTRSWAGARRRSRPLREGLWDGEPRAGGGAGRAQGVGHRGAGRCALSVPVRACVYSHHLVRLAGTDVPSSLYLSISSARLAGTDVNLFYVFRACVSANLNLFYSTLSTCLQFLLLYLAAGQGLTRIALVEGNVSNAVFWTIYSLVSVICFQDLPGNVLAAPALALCGWKSVIPLSAR